MCDELVKSYNKLKNDLYGDGKKYVEEANVYIIRQRNRGDMFYEWKRYDEVRFYKNYDYV